MVTITHTTFAVTLLAIILSFLNGKDAEDVRPIKILGWFFTSLGIGFTSAFVTFFVFSLCDGSQFCAPTHDMNVYHFLMPVIFFPVFWVAMLIGYSVRSE